MLGGLALTISASGHNILFYLFSSTTTLTEEHHHSIDSCPRPSGIQTDQTWLGLRFFTFVKIKTWDEDSVFSLTGPASSDETIHEMQKSLYHIMHISGEDRRGVSQRVVKDRRANQIVFSFPVSQKEQARQALARGVVVGGIHSYTYSSALTARAKPDN